mmetsp:Transcript_1095/g.1287  ORF Transcript_1095/g.1287 Transcript_1095/m.1287 type:complete len:146 (+) Transcript_1095:834-1271(+)
MGKYKPFELASGLDDEYKEEKKLVYDFANFSMKACDLTDEKSATLYQDMTQDSKPKKTKPRIVSKAEEEEQKAKAAAAAATASGSTMFASTAFSQRLQTENPFEEFRKAVEKAYVDKMTMEKPEFEVDQAFFREQDDVGMCLSMH